MLILETLDGFSRSYISTATFWTRALAAWERLTPSEIRMRDGDVAKKLMEEILPIASFLKVFESAGRRVRCRHFPGSQNYDARIRVEGNEVRNGFLQQNYFLEVTSALEPADYLRREALERNGGVFIGGEIARIGSRKKGDDRIESKAAARDAGAYIADAAAWTRAAIAKKRTKTYPSPCILLVSVQPEGPRPSIADWASLAEQVPRENDGLDPFAATYIVHSWTNTVFAV